MSEYTIVDLKKYLNHKIVFNPRAEKEIKGFDGDAFSEIGFFPFGDKVYSESGVPFVFARHEDNDNLNCANQLIPVETQKYNSIHFAGFMYWGGKQDYIELIYDDNTVETAKVCFYDWTSHGQDRVMELNMHPDFDRVKIFKRCISCCSTRTGYKGPLFVYTYTINLEQNKNLSAIKLPDNVFFHLFAITLEI